MGKLIQPVNPNDNMGLPENMPEMEAPIAGLSIQTKTDTVEQFEFKYKLDGKQYRAVITKSEEMGFACELTKWNGASWVKSVSRVKYGILGAFILQHAIVDLQQLELEANKKKPVQG